MTVKTADLCDAYQEQLQLVEPLFRHYGGRHAFGGRIATVKVHEDNQRVRAALEQDGAGQVLVVDGGGSLRSALLGDKIAQLAADRQWEGVLIYGCIRDAAAIARIPIGVLALATCPVRSKKTGAGETAVPVRFGGAVFRPGEYLYADEDGVVLSAQALA